MNINLIINIIIYKINIFICLIYLHTLNPILNKFNFVQLYPYYYFHYHYYYHFH